MIPIISEGDLRRSAVAIILTEENEIILEVRATNLLHQPGDICLPGGGLEEGENPEEAVIREVREELLVEKVDILSPVSILVSGLQEIHVFLCRVQDDYQGSFQYSEVQEILKIPTSFFRETKPEIHEISWIPDLGDNFPYDKIYGGRNYKWRERKSHVRFYQYGEYVIWGITARILEDFAGDKYQALSEFFHNMTGIG